MSPRWVLGALVVLGAIGAVIAGVVVLRGDDELDQAAYVDKNLRLLGELPVYPGVRATLRTSSDPYAKRDTPDAPVAGYYTTRQFSLSSETSARAVTAFYKSRMRGWRLDARSESRRSLSFRNGDAYVHVLVYTPRDYVIGVDHHCNGCPGP